jgi:predicted DNA-binding WGR domain protein
MPRYEFSEGSSSKFWEIKLDGSSFTTTYGKIGTPGQTTLKQWKDASEAKKEYDKLVHEKTKKGYIETAGDD